MRYLARLEPDAYGNLVNEETGRRERRHPKCRCRVPCQQRFPCQSTWHKGSRKTPYCCGAASDDAYGEYCDECTVAVLTYLERFKDDPPLARIVKQYVFNDPKDEHEFIVSFWIGAYSEEDVVDIMKDGCQLEDFSPAAARLVASVLRRLLNWRASRAGKKQIARLRDRAIQENTQ